MVNVFMISLLSCQKECCNLVNKTEVNVYNLNNFPAVQCKLIVLLSC